MTANKDKGKSPQGVRIRPKNTSLIINFAESGAEQEAQKASGIKSQMDYLENLAEKIEEADIFQLTKTDISRVADKDFPPLTKEEIEMKKFTATEKDILTRTLRDAAIRLTMKKKSGGQRKFDKGSSALRIGRDIKNGMSRKNAIEKEVDYLENELGVLDMDERTIGKAYDDNSDAVKDWLRFEVTIES